MPTQNSLVPILKLITEAIAVGGDLIPVALRAYAALKVDHSDEEFTALAREKNDLDEQKVLDLIARASG